METREQPHREAWNKGKLVGQRGPLKPKDIWAIRIHLENARAVRDLAVFNVAIDSKLRGCDLVSLRVRDVTHANQVLSRAMVVGLTLNCIDMREERIELSRPGCAHRARLLAFAVAPLQAWLTLQDEIHGTGPSPARKVFEADRSVGFGRLSNTVSLSASSVHRRTQKLLEAAGITGERACAQTLRNTYAGLLIEGGASDEQLIDDLGLQASVSAQRLRASFARSKVPPAQRHG